LAGVARDSAESVGGGEAGHAVAGVDDDAQAAARAHQTADDLAVVVAGAALLEGAGAALVVAAFGHRAEALDLVLGQRRRARMDHLDAVDRKSTRLNSS